MLLPMVGMMVLVMRNNNLVADQERMTWIQIKNGVTYLSSILKYCTLSSKRMISL